MVVPGSVTKWRLSGILGFASLLVAALTFVAVYRFRDTQSLIVLAKSIPNNAGHIQWGKPCWPVRDVDTYRISRWIGEDAELALLQDRSINDCPI